jgi:dynein heavy chain
VKLARAIKLVDGLKNEKTRWAHDINILKENGTYIIGDSVVAAGMVAYAGPFTSEYRK